MRLLFTIAALVGLASCVAPQGPVGPAQKYAVFFTKFSAALEPAAVQVIAQAADAAKAAPGLGVLVLGHTDNIGSKPDDVLLSQARARRVTDALVADGVAPSRIIQHGRGQTGEDPGLESRRVDITLTN